MIDMNAISSAIDRAIAFFRTKDNYPVQKDSGYFAIRTRFDGRVLAVFEQGVCLPEKTAKYFSLALEKGERLFHKMQEEDHVSSWQSRNEAEGKWGGAIVTDHYILSFSGLPELADEAAMMIVAQICGFAATTEMAKIATINNNPFFAIPAEWE